MTFDPTKPVRTRDGRAVTILATGVLARIKGTGTRKAGQTILALVGDDREADYFSADGSFLGGGESSWDLVNPEPEPVKTERFFALYVQGVEPRITEFNTAVQTLASYQDRPFVKVTYLNGVYSSAEVINNP